MRQINITWQLYSVDNDKLVANGFQNEGPHPENPYWVQGYLNHLLSRDLTNNILLLDNRYALFGDYLKMAKIYKCPSDKILFPLIGTPSTKVQKHRSYSLNWHLGMREDRRKFKKEFDMEFRERYLILKENNIINPESTITFIGVHPESICWPVFGINGDNSVFMYPSSAHSGRGNVAFADNHVISKKWLDLRTKTGSANWHIHFDYSFDNLDFVWLKGKRGVNF